MRLVMLGTAQDGGVPHVGCRCPTCEGARSGNMPRRLSPSMAIVDPVGGRAWLVDASPDLPEQLEAVKDALGASHGSGIPLEGILLTHVHMGHYWGLGHLGKEGMMPRGLPVIAPPGAVAFLKRNRPFKDLVSMGALELRAARQGDRVTMAGGLTAVPVEVPHREDFSDTVAWRFEGPQWSVLYAPDMDVLDERVIDTACGVDLALVDGTFYSRDEIPGAMDTVPHPPVVESMVALQPALEGGTRVAFTHLNHTNPLCDPRSPETEELLRKGYGLALDGYSIDI